MSGNSLPDGEQSSEALSSETQPDEAQPTLATLTTLPTLPVLAIVGRPNVGKSTLYNRIVGGREAVISSQPGVTRDRKQGEAVWSGRKFSVVDTGGWLAKDRIRLLTQQDRQAQASSSGVKSNEEEGGKEAVLAGKVSQQSERAMIEADAALLVVDVTVGVTEDDARVAALLRRLDIPTIVAANKVDSSVRDHDIWEFERLGLGEPWRISALHGRLVADLLDHVVGLLPEQPEVEAFIESDIEHEHEPEEDLQPGLLASVAIVGRPNVGKSTLFNRLIGTDRAIVHDLPGTTRDAIDTVVDTDFGPIRFVDTAGLRRKSKVSADTEYYANLRALRSITTADVSLLVIDATAGVTHQDQRLAERIDAVGSPLLVLLNKWELLNADERESVLSQVGDLLHFVGAAPVLRISALSGRGVHKLLPALQDAIDAYEMRIPTRQVNNAMRKAQSLQPGPGGVRVLYATQGATHPPTFTLFANRRIPPTYLRYLENFLRDEFELGATPIKMRVRRR